jgi:hypothetical protein
MNRNNTILISILSFLVVLVIAEPAQAQEASEQLEGINWLDLIQSLIKFIANILEASAELLRTSVDQFSEMFGSD